MKIRLTDLEPFHKWVFGISIFFLLLVLVMAYVIQNPPPSTQFITRLIASLGAGGFALGLTGFFQIDVKLLDIAVKAGGALGVFVFVYLKNPAGL